MTMRESMQKFCATYCPQAESWVDQLQFVEKQWGMFFTWQREQHKPEPLKKQPDTIVPCNLEVIVMPNGEVICLGKTVGWFKELAKFLTPKQ